MLVSNPAILRACVVSAADGTLVVRTEGQNLYLYDKHEMALLLNNFYYPPSMSNGVNLELILYRMVRLENNVMCGYKNGSGFFAVKNNKVIVIAVYEGNGFEGNRVHAMVDHLARLLE
ncbi:hypothetical protein CAEBREN_00889 [Caenorhabditis brenneri]|uniref:Profilin n=1 Tax=Caenorhabditis brenneri TaxID=135651 RepID=G0M8N0_CAEBE|nr:hypothetical protein CAEBREN_00889 [Caenorhabditis brenneri]